MNSTGCDMNFPQFPICFSHRYEDTCWRGFFKCLELGKAHLASETYRAAANDLGATDEKQIRAPSESSIAWQLAHGPVGAPMNDEDCSTGVVEGLKLLKVWRFLFGSRGGPNGLSSVALNGYHCSFGELAVGNNSHVIALRGMKLCIVPQFDQG